jgi:hypothetical protein
VSIDSKARRRWFGGLCLLAAFGMLILGETLLKGRIREWTFVLYWMGCLGFTFLAICTALWDVYAVRQEGRRAHRELLETTLDNVEKSRRDRN